MRILKFNESIDYDVLWKEIESTEYVKRIDDRERLTFSEKELKYISRILSKFKLYPPKSKRVTTPVKSFDIHNKNFGSSKDLKKVYIKSDTIDIEIIKDNDYNYFVDFSGGGHPYRFKKFYECDTLQGLIQCIESKLSNHHRKNDDVEVLRSDIQKMTKSLSKEDLLKVKELINSL